jgi:hypothetical protein
VHTADSVFLYVEAVFSSEHWQQPTNLHGVIAQNITLWIFTAAITSGIIIKTCDLKFLFQEDFTFWYSVQYSVYSCRWLRTFRRNHRPHPHSNSLKIMAVRSSKPLIAACYEEAQITTVRSQMSWVVILCSHVQCHSTKHRHLNAHLSEYLYIYNMRFFHELWTKKKFDRNLS